MAGILAYHVYHFTTKKSHGCWLWLLAVGDGYWLWLLAMAMVSLNPEKRIVHGLEQCRNVDPVRLAILADDGLGEISTCGVCREFLHEVVVFLHVLFEVVARKRVVEIEFVDFVGLIVKARTREGHKLHASCLAVDDECDKFHLTLHLRIGQDVEQHQSFRADGDGLELNFVHAKKVGLFLGKNFLPRVDIDQAMKLDVLLHVLSDEEGEEAKCKILNSHILVKGVIRKGATKLIFFSRISKSFGE